jgi:hypothetical protein
MTDIVKLDIGTSESALPIVRMVVGGVGSRLELSLDDLEDVYLALEELFREAGALGEGPRFTLTIEVGDESLAISTGPFRTEALRQRLTPATSSNVIDLHMLLAHIVESLEVCGVDDDCFAVVFRKSRGVT